MKDGKIVYNSTQGDYISQQPVVSQGKSADLNSFVFKLNLEKVDLTEGEYTMLIRPLWNPNTSEEDKELTLIFSGSEVEDVSGVEHNDGKKLF